MRIFKLMTAATLAIALVLFMANQTQGQVAEQHQEQELNLENNVRVNCTTGAYGQSSTCTAEANGTANGKQSQTQRMDGQQIVYRQDGTPVYVHTVADTGLDFYSLTSVMGSIVTGAAAAVIKLKNRVA